MSKQAAVEHEERTICGASPSGAARAPILMDLGQGGSGPTTPQAASEITAMRTSSASPSHERPSPPRFRSRRISPIEQLDVVEGVRDGLISVDHALVRGRPEVAVDGHFAATRSSVTSAKDEVNDSPSASRDGSFTKMKAAGSALMSLLTLGGPSTSRSPSPSGKRSVLEMAGSLDQSKDEVNDGPPSDDSFSLSHPGSRDGSFTKIKAAGSALMNRLTPGGPSSSSSPARRASVFEQTMKATELLPPVPRRP